MIERGYTYGHIPKDATAFSSCSSIACATPVSDIKREEHIKIYGLIDRYILYRKRGYTDRHIPKEATALSRCSSVACATPTSL